MSTVNSAIHFRYPLQIFIFLILEYSTLYSCPGLYVNKISTTSPPSLHPLSPRHREATNTSDERSNRKHQRRKKTVDKKEEPQLPSSFRLVSSELSIPVSPLDGFVHLLSCNFAETVKSPGRGRLRKGAKKPGERRDVGWKFLADNK